MNRMIRIQINESIKIKKELVKLKLEKEILKQEEIAYKRLEKRK